MDGEIYGREGEGRMRNNNVSHLQIGACWKQQRGRLQDSRFKRFNMIPNLFAFSFAITCAISCVHITQKKIYGNTEKTVPEKKSYRVVSSVDGVVDE